MPPSNYSHLVTATVLLLVAAYIALPKFTLLSPFFQELTHYAPYAIIAFAGLLSLRFGRSRVVYILSAIGTSLFGYQPLLRRRSKQFCNKGCFSRNKHATTPESAYFYSTKGEKTTIFS